MKYKASLGVHRATLENRAQCQIQAPKRQVYLFKQALHGHLAGLVDHQSQGATLAVFTHVNYTLVERVILHTRHRDQEMMRQVDRWYFCVHRVILAKALYDKPK